MSNRDFEFTFRDNQVTRVSYDGQMFTPQALIPVLEVKRLALELDAIPARLELEERRVKAAETQARALHKLVMGLEDHNVFEALASVEKLMSARNKIERGK